MKRHAVGVLSFVLCGCPGDDSSSDDAMAGTTGTTGTPTTTMNASETDPDDGSTTQTPDPTEDSDPTNDPSTGPDPATSGSGTDSGDTGSGLGQVRGAVVRVVPFGNMDDGIGDLYVGLLAACDQDAETVGDGDMIAGADFSMDGATVQYTIRQVPDGTHYVVAFLDDDLNADPEDPGPDLGDMATAEGLGPKCVEVTVSAGADVVAPAAVELNIVVPF
jgi:hypothetical protein